MCGYKKIDLENWCRKEHPVAKPDKMINKSSFRSMDFISDCLFFTKTISQAMINTTLVRMAVPKLESIPEIPILPKIDVRLANIADKIAYINQLLSEELDSDSSFRVIINIVPTPIMHTQPILAKDKPS